MALVDNKEKIQALLAGINALPNAGSGEPAEPVLQEKSVTPTKEAQSIAPDAGYDGLSAVNVGAIPDEYIVPSGTVQIMANGTHNVREAESVNVNVVAPEIALQEKTVTPSESAQTITPDSGYNGLSQVSVGAISKTYVGSGVTKQAAKTITPSTSSQTAVASGVYTTGAVTVGAIPSTYVKPTATKAATTYTPSTSNQTIAAGTYCSGAQTIKGDANLVPANIAEGVSIFGVTGTHAGGGSGGGTSVETCTVIVSGDQVYDIYYSTPTMAAYDTVVDGKRTMKVGYYATGPGYNPVAPESFTIENVVCGGHVILYDGYSSGWEVSKCELVSADYPEFSVFCITASAGETAEIHAIYQ